MKIAVVNSHPTAVEAIRRALASAHRHQVIWVARDGAEAVKMCAGQKPDLLLLDLALPVLTGVEATRQIMAKTPCAILIVTADMQDSSSKVFDALGAGALDAVNTPQLDCTADSCAALLQKIKMVERLLFDSIKRTRPLPSPRPAAKIVSGENQLVAIGASAGGPMALAEILGHLPADFPAAVIIVQHVDPQFSEGLADWLNAHSKLPVRLAREGDKPVRGAVLLAGTGDHLAFINAATLGYTPDPVGDYPYRPSVDVFFHSIVKHWRGDTVGVLLTGMGRDGAQGLKMLRQAGRHTIAQNSATCLVYGMPKAAVALDAAVEILPLNRIGPTLQKIYPPSGVPAP